MNIGETIKYWRCEKGITQKQLAEKANISEISIRKYEANDRTPKIETIKKIADALNVTIGDLDPEYAIMNTDRSDALNLVSQIEQFLENVPKTDKSENFKRQAIEKANVTLEKTRELINLIDTGISTDKEMKDILDESRELREEIQEIQRDMDEMCLSVLHRLTPEGQEIAINYAIVLSNIPKYQKDKK